MRLRQPSEDPSPPTPCVQALASSSRAIKPSWISVKHGDTIHVETTVLSKRESASRPDSGIVAFKRRFVNQHGQAAQEMEITILYRRRPPGSPAR